MGFKCKKDSTWVLSPSALGSPPHGDLRRFGSQETSRNNLTLRNAGCFHPTEDPVTN